MKRFQRYDPSDIHWLLIDATRDERDETVADDDWIPAQALFCPYYAPLEGIFGSDWGVIVNPESVKFGRLVFEHHWCGCPTELDLVTGEHRSVHGGGRQEVDEWALPPSQRKSYRWTRRARRRGKQVAP